MASDFSFRFSLGLSVQEAASCRLLNWYGLASRLSSAFRERYAFSKRSVT